MNIDLSSSTFFKALSTNWVLALVFALILLLIGMLLGYIIGNTSLRQKVAGNIDSIEREKQIQKAVLDNVGMGIIVYDTNEAIFANETIFKLPGFPTGGVPKTLEGFLETFDKDNQLKSNYILSCENGVNVIRVNYCVERRIYEIKIIKKKGGAEDRFFENQDFAIVIVDDITQIKDDERRQKDLAANVSHELKTPLTSINNSVFSILHACNGKEMPSHSDLTLWAQRIQVNSTRMQDIVNDFLVLSQCSHTSVMGIFDLKEITDKAILNVSEYPGRAQVAFSLPESGDYPLVYGNSKLIMRTIINLITNAIKYIDYDGKRTTHQIHISIINVDDRIGVQVEDNGRGIPAKDIDHLFERFYRVDNSGSRDVGGSGIGLAIAKEIADMHDGAISVTSTYGSGSTFTLSLPTGKSVFESVNADAKAGIISEKPLYRAAAFFLGMQECEAAKSMGFSDLYGQIDAFEKIEETDVLGREKELVKLIKAYGDSRFNALEEELLFNDDFYEDEIGEIIDEVEGAETDAVEAVPEEANEEVIDNFEERIESEAMESKLREEEHERLEEVSVPEVTTNETVSQPSVSINDIENSIDPAEEEKRLAREEARKLLTQPVVQRAQNVAEPRKNAVELSKIKKDSQVIHPTLAGKRYNIEGSFVSGKKKHENRQEKAAQAEPSTPAQENLPKSSLKQVLDGTKPLSE